MRVRVREHHKRDFDLYYEFGDMLSRTKITKVGDPTGYTPIECYVLLDSHGEIDRTSLPCTDYDTLDRVLRGKGNVNLQIKMWIDGVMEGTFFKFEIKEWTKDYPEWVYKSFENQLKRTQGLI